MTTINKEPKLIEESYITQLVFRCIQFNFVLVVMWEGRGRLSSRHGIAHDNKGCMLILDRDLVVDCRDSVTIKELCLASQDTAPHAHAQAGDHVIGAGYTSNEIAMTRTETSQFKNNKNNKMLTLALPNLQM